MGPAPLARRRLGVNKNGKNRERKIAWECACRSLSAWGSSTFYGIQEIGRGTTAVRKSRATGVGILGKFLVSSKAVLDNCDLLEGQSDKLFPRHYQHSIAFESQVSYVCTPKVLSSECKCTHSLNYGIMDAGTVPCTGDRCGVVRSMLRKLRALEWEQTTLEEVFSERSDVHVQTQRDTSRTVA